MKPLIRCKVARILSDRELVVNAGSKHGVSEGMEFNVLGYVDIADPDTQELLETIQVTKIAVRVSMVSDKVSVARTFRRIESPVTKAFSTSIFAPQTERISTSQISRDSDWDNVVRIGDDVVQSEEDWS